MPLSVVFMGTPEFALPALQSLLDEPDIQVRAVFCQPDRPAGRGQKLTPPPVKQLALTHQLPVYQPTRLRKEPDMIDTLRSFEPDFLVTAAFGQILPQAVLDIPKYGTVNVHASLLPRYRGANPIQWSILNGDPETGVTTMLTVLAVDAGPMLRQISVPIDPMDTTATLTEKVAQAGGQILPSSLKDMASGALSPQEQEDRFATHAPKLEKTDAPIDWTLSASVLHNRIRGCNPWPGAVTMLDDLPLKLHGSLPPDHPAYAALPLKTGHPGEILSVAADGLVIQTGQGPLIVTTLQPPGKPKMPAKDWANGALSKTQTRQLSSPALVP